MMPIIERSGFEVGSIDDLPRKPFNPKRTNPHLPDVCPHCGRLKPDMLMIEFEPVKQTRCEKCYAIEGWQ